MIIYREQKQEVHSGEYIPRIREALDAYEQSDYTDHSRTVDVLIEFGEFETAVIDALNSEMDSINDISRAFSHASLTAGRLFYRSWEGVSGRAELVGELRNALERVSLLAPAHAMWVGMPEGFVYYGLFPETYIEAAKRFFRDIGPEKVVCIGLRNIGAALSAVVSATLAELGCETLRYTVRPRGHPFDRHLVLSSAFARRLATLAGWRVVLADEGPGLSGSSFGCSARKMSELGHADDHITFFPSWEPEHLGFASGANIDRWRKHRKYSADFEEVCLGSGKLFGALPGEFLDLSAGKWRSLFYNHPAEYPAVFPAHERRKLLSHNGYCRKIQGWRADVDPAAIIGKDVRFSGCLLKFAGLGRYGRETRSIAERLAGAGFAPPVVGLVNGFLVARFVQGSPLTRKSRPEGLLTAIARYLAFLKEYFPAEEITPFEQMREMVQENVSESLGEIWIRRLGVLDTRYSRVNSRVATFVDGRMFPHEWIDASGVYLKTDGANHFNDHFFPGRQDIAWDIVGTDVEFGLSSREREFLLHTYMMVSGDSTVVARLPFYRIVYLSYRLGYAVEAANALASTPDGDRFRVHAARYKALLRTELETA